MTRQQLYENICRKQSFLCVGLDTDLKKVPQHLLDRAATDVAYDAIFEFNKAIIDATAPYCIAYKPNLAFYEAHALPRPFHHRRCQARRHRQHLQALRPHLL